VDVELPAVAKPPVAGGLPRACWSCVHFDDVLKTCTKWSATPPDDVQKVGCDAWEEFEEALPF
jgi:hypothetical protein